MPDTFSPNVKYIFRMYDHIFFNSIITIENVNKLHGLIKECENEGLERMRANRKTNTRILEPIHLHITSHGGDEIAGLYAYNFIKESKIPIITIVDKYAIDSAVILFIAGKKRFMTKDSYILIPPYRVHDTKIFDITEKIYDIILANIRDDKSHTLTKDILKARPLYDVRWTFEICKKYGIVDDIYINYMDLGMRSNL